MKKGSKMVPLISCLCVTEGRVNKLARAIRCFFDQTYQHKEMVIVYKDTDTETASYLLGFEGKLTCVALDCSKELTLGEKRNISILHSKGEYICNWDDDDWYHPERLEKQLDSIVANKAAASMLAYYLVFDEKNTQGYLSYFRLWESTIMCNKKSLRKIRYPSLNRNEDYEFMKQVIINVRVYPLIAPETYIYVYHGNNTCTEDHFTGLFKQCKKLSKKTSRLISRVLKGRDNAGDMVEELRSSKVRAEFDYFYDYKMRLLKQASS